MPGADIDVEITGLAELEKAFEALGRAGSKAALGAALRKAARPIADEANRLAPVGEDEDKPANKRLRGSFKVRSTLSKNQRRGREKRGLARVYVGSSAPHAHLYEFGHAQVHGRGQNRRVIRHVPGRPILRPAFDMLKRQVAKSFGELVWQELLRVAKRYRRQAERGKLSRGARAALGDQP